MSTLAVLPSGNLLILSAPPESWLTEAGPGLTDAAKLNLWHGLAPGTRSGYKSARESFEYFCSARGSNTYPAQQRELIEWITLRGSGSAEPFQGKVSADTLRHYLAAIRSVHVDRSLPLSVFDDKTLRRVLDGIRRRQPARESTQAVPLTLDILQKVVNVDAKSSHLTSSGLVDEVNMTAAMTTAYSAMLRSGEITYSASDLKNQTAFADTAVLRQDVTFGDDHVILSLKRSKTDYEHKGVSIVVASTGSSTCPVKALKRLFELDPQPPTAPLFRLSSRVFSYENFVAATRSRLRAHNVPNAMHFSGHSFRRGAATTAKLNGMLDSDIQRLGRWSSEAFQRYIDTDAAYKFRLSRQFLSGSSPPFTSPKASV